MVVKFAEVFFVIAFVTGIAGALCVIAWIFVECVVTPIVRAFWPNWAVLPLAPDMIKKVDHKEVRLSAQLYLLEERIRRANAFRKIQREFSGPVSEVARDSADGAAEWDLDSIKKALVLPPLLVIRPQDRKDEWSIAIFESDLKHPIYLCRKVSTKDGLKTCWANLPTERLKMSLEAARRWLSMLPSTAVIVPSNAAARIALREELKEIAQVQ
jgi:hypothetical protein